MARVGKWLTYAQHECLYLVGPCYGGDHVVPAMQMKSCPKCGRPCGLWDRDTWAKVVRRKVYDSAWYMPWTWGRYHWEYKLRGHLDDRNVYRASMRNARIAPART